MSRAMKMYSLHDGAAQAHDRPFAARSHGEALRVFGDLVNDAQHPVGQHPEDYTLFYHGEFDLESGELAGTAKLSLGNGVDFVRGAE